jgi:nicotinate-nucleotide adenylyltransferase
LPAAERPGAPTPAQRIGLLGGTFDPPHAGHLALARSCPAALALDRLLLVVANDPWQKAPVRAVSPAEDRYALVAAMAAEVPGVEASRLEIDRGGPSYTVDTVEELRAAGRAGGSTPEIFLIVGADLVPGLSTWERAGELAQLVTLAVVSRPQSPFEPVPEPWRSVALDGPGIDVSSSEVRDLLAAGKSVDGLVPEPVIRCIRRRNLYAVPR